LLKARRQLAGERGQQTVPVVDPNSQWPWGVHVSGYKVSMKKAEAVCRKLLATARSKVLSAD